MRLATTSGMETSFSGELGADFLISREDSQVVDPTYDRSYWTGKPGVAASLVRRHLAQLQQRRQARRERRAGIASATPEAKLVDVDSAPGYLRRPFINTGYLIGGTPAEAAWKTLFSWNNETLNAWTMLPACIVAILGVIWAREHLPTEVTPFTIFLLSSAPHAPFALRLHCTIGCSEATRDLWRTLDVFFIFTCSVVRAAALGWYVFPQASHYATFMGLVTLNYCYSLLSTMVLRRIKDIPKATLARVVTASISWYTLPLAVAAYREAATVGPGTLSALYCAIVSFVVFGGLAYALKYPERWAPGKFDIIGSGHQLMHVTAAIEYTLELVMLWQLAQQRVTEAGMGLVEDKEVGRLLGLYQR